MQQNALDSEDKKQEPRELEQPLLVGNVYPVFLNFDHETTGQLLAGMISCFDRNPDPGFSVYRLMARIQELIVFSENPEELALICEVQVDDFGNNYLFLWGAYANNVKYDKVRAYNTLKWAAGQLDCRYIETVSQRAGWLKMLSKLDDVEVVPTVTYRINM